MGGMAQIALELGIGTHQHGWTLDKGLVTDPGCSGHGMLRSRASPDRRPRQTVAGVNSGEADPPQE